MKTLPFETGISDRDKPIGTMLKSTFAKRKPKQQKTLLAKHFKKN